MRSKALRRARRAYELAHVIAALRGCVAAILVVSLAMRLSPSTQWMITVAIFTVATVAVNGWRGGAWRRGSLVGLAAGMPAIALHPLIAAVTGDCVVRTPERAAACFVAGALAGRAIAAIAACDRDPSAFMVVASIVAMLTGLLGCGWFGLVGGIAVVVGVSSALLFETRSASSRV